LRRAFFISTTDEHGPTRAFAGTPLFLNVFNSVDEFIQANNLKAT